MPFALISEPKPTVSGYSLSGTVLLLGSQPSLVAKEVERISYLTNITMVL